MQHMMHRQVKRAAAVVRADSEIEESQQEEIRAVALADVDSSAGGWLRCGWVGEGACWTSLGTAWYMDELGNSLVHGFGT